MEKLEIACREVCQGHNFHGLPALADIMHHKIDIHTPIYGTDFYSSMSSENPLIAGVLQDKGVEFVNDSGVLLLNVVASAGNRLSAQLLFNRFGANVTFADGLDNTALHVAVAFEQYDMVRDLISIYHANCDQKNLSGFSPYELAQQISRKSEDRYVQELMEDIMYDEICKIDNIDAMEADDLAYYYQWYEKLTETNNLHLHEFWQEIFHAIHEHYKVQPMSAEYSLALCDYYRIDVNTPIFDTDFYSSMDDNCPLLVNVINEHGRDFVNNASVTLMNIAIRYNEDPEDIVWMVEVQGADVHLQDGLGNTALHIAAAYEKEDIIEMLLSRYYCWPQCRNIENVEGCTAYRILRRTCRRLRTNPITNTPHQDRSTQHFWEATVNNCKRRIVYRRLCFMWLINRHMPFIGQQQLGLPNLNNNPNPNPHPNQV
jgi:ankyrin repeat protein